MKKCLITTLLCLLLFGCSTTKQSNIIRPNFSKTKISENLENEMTEKDWINIREKLRKEIDSKPRDICGYQKYNFRRLPGTVKH